MAPATNPKTAITLSSLSGVFIEQVLLPIDQLQACYRSVLEQPGLTTMYHTQGLTTTSA